MYSVEKEAGAKRFTSLHACTILSQGIKSYARSVLLSLLRSYIAVPGMVQTKI